MNIFATQNLKMNKFFFVFFVFLTQLNFAQTQEEILKEADKRNISTKQQVLNQLAQNGISEQAAREMAVMRGIDFDTFLNEYFSNNNSTTNTSNKLDQTENTVVKFQSKMISSCKMLILPHHLILHSKMKINFLVLNF